MRSSMQLLMSMFIFSSNVAIADDSGYSRVSEMKSWTSSNNIYLETSTHSCGGSDTHRFNLDKEDGQKFGLLVTAMASGMVANLNYTCGTDGYPVVNGVRVRPG